MKKIIVFVMFSILAISAMGKEVKISVTPSDAKIYIDGNYAGDGIVTATMKNDFIVVKMELSGYVTQETKIYKSDKRKGVSFTLRRDMFFDATVESGVVNKFFTVDVSPEFYTIDEDGKQDASIAWKKIHQILLDYFDEIQTTDMNSGFILTPWKYKTYPEADKQIRTRVTIRQINAGDELTFQIKISSEVASLIAAHRDDSFQNINRIDKEMEPLVSELQSRIARK